MGNQLNKKRLSKMPQIGDMRERVSIYDRGMVAPVAGSMEFVEGLTLVATVWAMMETTSGYHIFDGDKMFDGVDVNTDNKTIHQFTIRYRDDIEYQQVIKYKGFHYQIMKVENSESRSRFLFLYCVMLGDDTKEVNK